VRKTDAYRRMIAGIQFAAWRNDLTSLVSRTALAQRHFRGFFCVGWFQTPAGLSAFWAQAFSHMLVVLGAEPGSPPAHPTKIRFAADSRWRKTDSNSRSLREGKGYGQPLQASIAVSDLNL